MNRARRPSALFLALFTGVAAIGLGACSSSSTAHGASGASAPIEAGPSEEVSCQNDSRLSSDALPLAVMGAQGYSVTLNERTPDPAARGLNQWSVTVADATGSPVVGAALDFTTKMPDHGHSSTPPIAPATDAQGVSNVPDLDFFMAGVWQIQIDVYPANAAANAHPVDSVTFFFCIEG